jgi:putative transposase
MAQPLAQSQHAVNYPEDIRKAIYTTNAIESLNSVIRKAVKKRKLFPTDDSAKNVIYLAIQDASKRWTMPIRNWKLALNRFMIEFEDRLVDYVLNWQLHRNIYSLARCWQRRLIRQLCRRSQASTADNTAIHGKCRYCRGIMQVEFTHEIGPVFAYRLNADRQKFSYFSIFQSLCDQL